MSLDLSSVNPETVVLGATAAVLGIYALSRGAIQKLGSSFSFTTGSDNQVLAPVLPPQQIQVPVPPPQAVVAAPQPPLPPVVHPADQAHAVICQYLMIQILFHRQVNTTPEIWTGFLPPVQNGPRIRGRSNINMRTCGEAAYDAYINRLWNGSKHVGAFKVAHGIGADPGPLFNRFTATLRAITPYDTRFLGRGLLRTFVQGYPYRVISYRVDRARITWQNGSDPFWEALGIRFDVKWLLDFFIMHVKLAEDHGCTFAQARYIGHAAAINILLVYYGFAPGTIIPGASPEALGINLPAVLPANFT